MDRFAEIVGFFVQHDMHSVSVNLNFGSLCMENLMCKIDVILIEINCQQKYLSVSKMNEKLFPGNKPESAQPTVKILSFFFYSSWVRSHKTTLIFLWPYIMYNGTIIFKRKYSKYDHLQVTCLI